MWLEPEEHTVHIRFRVPYLKNLVAGAGTSDIESLRVRRWIGKMGFWVAERS